MNSHTGVSPRRPAASQPPPRLPRKVCVCVCSTPQHPSPDPCGRPGPCHGLPRAGERTPTGSVRPPDGEEMRSLTLWGGMSTAVRAWPRPKSVVSSSTISHLEQHPGVAGLSASGTHVADGGQKLHDGAVSAGRLPSLVPLQKARCQFCDRSFPRRTPVSMHLDSPRTCIGLAPSVHFALHRSLCSRSTLGLGPMAHWARCCSREFRTHEESYLFIAGTARTTVVQNIENHVSAASHQTCLTYGAND